jgi:hypothetical protein
MSDQFSSQADDAAGFKMDLFIPFVILSVSVIILLAWQVYNFSTQRTTYENTITRAEPSVSQAQHLQESVSKIAADLMTAAQTDDLAKEIVAKYKIQQQGTPSVPDASTPAAAASATP